MIRRAGVLSVSLEFRGQPASLNLHFPLFSPSFLRAALVCRQRVLHLSQISPPPTPPPPPGTSRPPPVSPRPGLQSQTENKTAIYAPLLSTAPIYHTGGIGKMKARRMRRTETLARRSRFINNPHLWTVILGILFFPSFFFLHFFFFHLFFFFILLSFLFFIFTENCIWL